MRKVKRFLERGAVGVLAATMTLGGVPQMVWADTSGTVKEYEGEMSVSQFGYVQKVTVGLNGDKTVAYVKDNGTQAGNNASYWNKNINNATDIFKGKSKSEIEAMNMPDVVSGATVSWEAMKKAVVMAVAEGEGDTGEDIKVPTESLDLTKYNDHRNEFRYYPTVLKIPVRLYNSSKDIYSIGDSSIEYTAYAIVDSGTSADANVEIKLRFKDMEYAGTTGNISALYYFDSYDDMKNWKNGKDTSTIKSTVVDATTSSGMPYEVSFTLPSKDAVIWLATKVPAMGNAITDVRLGLDYSKAEMLEGKEELSFWTDLLSTKINKKYYKSNYPSIYESDLYDAKQLLEQDNPQESSVKQLTKSLSGSYASRKYYESKAAVLKNAQNYQKAEQGDFTDESWKNLQDVAEEAVDWLSGDKWTIDDVVEYDERLTEAVSALQFKEGCTSYSKRLRELMYDLKLLDSSKYLGGSLNTLLRNSENRVSRVDWNSEIACRTAYESIMKDKEEYLTEKMVHVADGRWQVSAKAYLKNSDGEYVETHAFDEWIDFNNIEMNVNNGIPTLSFQMNMSEELPLFYPSAGSYSLYPHDSGWGEGTTFIDKEFPYTDWQGNETTETRSFATLFNLRALDQADREHMFLKGSVYDKEGNRVSIEGKTSNTIYLDIDYDNAKKLEDKKVDKSQLESYVNEYASRKVEDLVNDGYTREFSEEFVNAVKEGKAVYRTQSSTQQEVDAATAKIKNLLNNTVTYQGEYKKAMQEAKDILAYSEKRSLYTTDSVDALEKVYKEAYAKISALENPSNEDYIEATDAVNTAREALVREKGSDIDKSVLEQYIQEASAIGPDGYTEASYQSLLNVLEEAKALRDAEKVTQSEIDTKTMELYAGIKALQEAAPDEVNAAALKAELAKAKAIDGSIYTKESYDALTAVIQATEELLGKEGLTQEEVNAQKTALEEAVNNLETLADATRKELNDKISEAEAKAKEEGYTEASYEQLNAAIAAAKEAVTDTDATTEALTAQIQALTAAMEAMEKAPEETLEDGVYEIPVELWKAASDELSIGNGAIAGSGKIKITDGEGRLYIQLQQMNTYGTDGFLGELNLMKNIKFNDKNYPVSYDKEPATVEAEFQGYDNFNDPETGTDAVMKGRNYPEVVSIPVDVSGKEDLIWTQLYIPVMNALGTADQNFGVQEARLHLDWSKLQKAEVADKTALEAKLEEAKAYKADDYTAESYQVLQTAIQTAENVMNRVGVTQDAVDAQVTALDAAIQALVETEKVDKSKLAAQIEAAEALKKDDYTADTWKVLEEALAAAKEVNENADATQADVNKSLNALSKAIKELKNSELDKNQLADGKYTVEVHLWHANKDQASMGDPALNHTALLEVKNGVYTLTISGHPVTLGTITANLTSMEIKQADGTYKAAEIVARNIEGGKPSAFQFVLPSKDEYIDVKIDPQVSILGGAVDARLKLGWDTLKKAADDATVDDNTKTEVISNGNTNGDNNNDSNNNNNNNNNNNTSGVNSGLTGDNTISGSKNNTSGVTSGLTGTTGVKNNTSGVGSSLGGSTKTGGVIAGSTKSSGSVKTGDTNRPATTAATGVFAAGIAALCAAVLRKRKPEEEK